MDVTMHQANNAILVALPKVWPDIYYLNIDGEQ